MRFFPAKSVDRPGVTGSPRHGGTRAPTAWPLILAELLGGGVLLLGTFGVLRYEYLSGSLPRAALVLLGLVALVLLVLRHRFPVIALLGLSALLGLLPSAALLTAIAAYALARHMGGPRRRDATLILAGLLVVLVTLARIVLLQNGTWHYALALGAVLAAVSVLVPGLVGTAAGHQDRLVAALRERAAAALRAERSVEREAVVHERSRIAAEMHDLVGHRLSLVALHAGGLELALDGQSPQLREEAAQLRQVSRDAMEELRQVLGVLGPLGRDTGTEALTDATGTRSDVLALVEESRTAGVPVEFSWQGEDLDTVPAKVRRAVNRVVRESLTNVHRYAPGAAVEVTVSHTPGWVETVVRNGPSARPGAAGQGTGRGLNGLRERVALLDGTFAAGPERDGDPERDGGFAVRAVIPTGPSSGTPQDRAAAPAPETVLPETVLPETVLPETVLVAPDRESLVRRRVAGAVSVGLGLVGLGVMLVLGLALVQEARPYDVPVEPSTVHLGMTSGEVETIAGSDSPAVRSAAVGNEPARPATATRCLFPYTGRVDSADRLLVTRYCFQGDYLRQITYFTTPLAP